MKHYQLITKGDPLLPITQSKISFTTQRKLLLISFTICLQIKHESHLLRDNENMAAVYS